MRVQPDPRRIIAYVGDHDLSSSESLEKEILRY